MSCPPSFAPLKCLQKTHDVEVQVLWKNPLFPTGFLILGIYFASGWQVQEVKEEFLHPKSWIFQELQPSAMVWLQYH